MLIALINVLLVIGLLLDLFSDCGFWGELLRDQTSNASVYFLALP